MPVSKKHIGSLILYPFFKFHNYRLISDTFSFTDVQFDQEEKINSPITCLEKAQF